MDGMDILAKQDIKEKECFETELENYIFINSGN